jgi:gluconate 2-dehydrogenase alpha chain
MKTLPRVEVAIVGGGWAGLLMAKELATRTALSIVVLERGKARGTDEYAADMDEVDYGVRLKMMQEASQETVTFRHSTNERALPLRQFANFLPGSGIGGAGEHWNALFPRNLPDVFNVLTRSKERYGAARLPENHSIQDWGISYQELEPYYTRLDHLIGTSGKAGNLRGTIIEGGNPFEGPRSEEYPLPPTKQPYFAALLRDSAKSLGYHPYPIPSAAATHVYRNPDGVTRPPCVYCGYCERYGCMIGAKAQPSNLLLPVLKKKRNVTIRTGAWVRRIAQAKTASRKNSVTGVSYIDANGQEIFQPAEIVFLASWTLSNTRLLLLSDIGTPYDPSTGKGTLGRNLTHQLHMVGATGFFDKPLNRFMGAGSSGMMLSDFDGDNFDHGNLDFLRGGVLQALNTGAHPISDFGEVPESVKSDWGSEWKKAAIDAFDRTGRMIFSAEHLAYKHNFMDLDPTYKDVHGDPLLRMTLDWTANERNMATFGAGKAATLLRAMRAKEVRPFGPLGKYDTRRYQSTHVQGGTILGTSPQTSAVNTYGQHWDAENLFVLGGSTFPQAASANPTPTLLALTLRTADAVAEKYTKAPGMLA